MTKFQSLFFYILAFGLSALMLQIGMKRKLKPLTFVGLIIPIFIAGLRYYVGTDYQTYVNNISWVGDIPFSLYIRNFSSYLEPSFYLFARLSHYINYPHLVFFIYSTISITFLYKALKTSGIKQVGLVYFLFLTILFPMSFNMVRQFAAIAVAVYAVTLLHSGKQNKFYIFTILAALLHTSALINIVALVVYRRINKGDRSTTFIYKLISSIIALATLLLIGRYGLHKYSYLFDTAQVTANLNFIPRLMMMVTVLTLLYTSINTYYKYKFYIYLGILSIAMGLIGFFVPYGDRLSLYFFPFVIMLLPTSVYNLMPPSKKHLTLLFMISTGLLYFTASYYILGSHAIMPYRVIFGASI